ncbi:nucleoside phosphorylase domain-containing protein [Neurospora tetraspora]|uniref:Nucleoside phosphorylase domain-containing protein n=1 Tax=Neurospora tetraspora TaxID=94610 RepID=A0AAE0MSJ4_9PEZI|nr:nucleoside phosphorylase domain-containing protein [Neurospora tetraspora]
MGKCNVVLVLLPNMGKASAASAAASLRSSYPRVSLALLVGICGAVPFAGPERDPIVLGDVIISNLVVQYDLGRALPDRFVRKDTAHNSLGRSNRIIRKILIKLDTDIDREHIEKRAGDFLKALQTKSEEKAKRKRRGRHTSYKYPGAANDLLFPARYRHKHASGSGCRTCEDCHGNADPACDESLTLSCKELECDTSCVIRREHLESASNDPMADSDSEGVFFFIGAIGSGDSVIRSGEHRDQIAKQAGVIAFEMEGAGVWDEVPCIVIKGVCDYADSHKNKGWQNYAAATAASVAKAVMERYVASARVSDSSQATGNAAAAVRDHSFLPRPRFCRPWRYSRPDQPEGGREAVCACDGDEQGEARGRSSRHAGRHGQPGINLQEPRPVGRGREAVCAGDGDEQGEARGRSSLDVDEHGQPGCNSTSRRREWGC